ncbi:hypothetical protein [Sphingobacterium gobiense]|uniref:hypothetical protein n=1 Tax=Sphingobacterium gobiense TaxID=1382456 RepID=UPI0011B02582|nr:hypothetical protein [Sphingobacterium gobiense]
MNLNDSTKFSIGDSTFIQYNPEWSDLELQFINDSTVYSILPLSPTAVKGEKKLVVNLSNHREFILFKNNDIAYFGKYIYQENEDGVVLDAAFLSNGTLTLDNLLNGNTSFYTYSNGKGSKLQLAGEHNLLEKMSSSSSVSSNTCAEYRTVVTCDWMAICHETGQIHIRLSPVGTCLMPSEIRCGKSWANWSLRAQIPQTICIRYGDPEPPIGGGGGGDDGGGSETPPPSDEEKKRQAKLKLLNETRKTDCDAIALANKKGRDNSIINLINRIRNRENEWGTMFKFETLGSEAISLGVEWEGKKNSINYTPKWNTGDGYHVGFIHTHPSKSAPSPSDVYNPLFDLNNFVNDPEVNEDHLRSYIDNFASVVVSGDYIYTISMKDTFRASLMKGGFNQENENNLYRQFVKDYLRHTTDVSVEQYQEAGEYAILKLYGDGVHISKQKIGSPDSNEIIKLGEKKKSIKKEKPKC